MYLFSRVVTLQGPPADTMAWAMEVTEHVNSKISVPTSCWVSVFGRPIGTFSWSSILESHAQLAELGGQLAADNKYHSLLAKAEDWTVTPGEDSLRSIVSGMPTEGTPPGIGASATVNTGVMAPGHFAEALAWSVEVASYVTELTGTPVLFLTDQYGAFGGVSWISVAADVATVDAGAAKLAGDMGFASRIDAAADFFVTGSVNAALLSRIA